jgi:hypothetical protein
MVYGVRCELLEEVWNSKENFHGLAGLEQEEEDD